MSVGLNLGMIVKQFLRFSLVLKIKHCKEYYASFGKIRFIITLHVRKIINDPYRQKIDN